MVSPKEAPSGHGAGKTVPLPLMRLKFSAKENTGRRYDSLMCQLKVPLLSRAYHELDERKATGTDGITKACYGRDLAANLKDLETRLHRGSYRPQPARQVCIPQADGKMRPLAISNLEDKIVQRAVAYIVEALYEPLFTDASLGFRPRRGGHQAIRRVYHLLKDGRRPHVVDVDIEKFFNSMNHERMMEFLEKRISDPRFLRLMAKLLRTSVMVDGETQENEVGSPQGSIVSPLLANIFLHYVLDLWFKERFGGYRQQMVRYADDVVFCFHDQDEAESFLPQLKERFQAYQLSVNESKTKIVDFGNKTHNVFHFLGFTLYWGKTREGKTLLKLKTQTERLRAKILSFKEWIKGARAKYRTQVLWKKAAEKIRGHYAYFGVTFNSRLTLFYKICVQLMFKWLNRRSQKRSYSWEGFLTRLKAHPLPKPWGYSLLALDQGVFSYGI
jgi:group II intron reverse transcriptase/maturase